MEIIGISLLRKVAKLGACFKCNAEGSRQQKCVFYVSLELALTFKCNQEQKLAFLFIIKLSCCPLFRLLATHHHRRQWFHCQADAANGDTASPSRDRRPTQTSACSLEFGCSAFVQVRFVRFARRRYVPRRCFLRKFCAYACKVSKTST